MSLDEFLDRYRRAADAFSRGDPKPVEELYSEADDVTLANRSGRHVAAARRSWAPLDYASSRMSDGQVAGFDELARYMSDELATILEVEHWRARIGDRCVARQDNKVWSLYGAPRLQPVATGRKSDAARMRRTTRKPLPWVATGCDRVRMVRRGSTVRVRQRACEDLLWSAAPVCSMIAAAIVFQSARSMP